LTTEQRAIAERAVRNLAAVVDGGDPVDESKARHVLVSDMLLVYPLAGASAEAGRARGNAYREALSDVPAWAVKAVISRWHRGECGDHDFRWAPSPATLRELCIAEIAPYKQAIEHIETVLSAGTMEDAMGQSPMRNPLVPKFRAAE